MEHKNFSNIPAVNFFQRCERIFKYFSLRYQHDRVVFSTTHPLITASQIPTLKVMLDCILYVTDVNLHLNGDKIVNVSELMHDETAKHYGLKMPAKR